MQFPIFKLTPGDLALLWALVDKYPQYRDKRYEIRAKIFGITVHPSFSVKGIIKDIFGDRP
jgi:hypothetical protein